MTCSLWIVREETDQFIDYSRKRAHSHSLNLFVARDAQSDNSQQHHGFLVCEWKDSMPMERYLEFVF